MNPSEEIDAYIAKFPDWRGAKIAHLRQTILAADSEITETWKWMGSPVWEHNGILCVAGIYKGKSKLTFHDGAALADPDGLFNAELEGNKRRAIDFFEDEDEDEDEATTDEALQNLIRSAIAFRVARPTK